MKTLAIDTSTAAATAAVTEDEKLLGVMTVNLNKPHSQKIMCIVESLLNQLELKAEDIDLFAAAHGPGSFTGLRIGVAAVKGFADAVNKTAVGVSTLEALAFPYDGTVCPLLDAKRDMVYYALYEGKTIIKPDCENIEVLVDKLKKLDKKIIFIGDCVEKYQTLISEKLDNAVFVHKAFCCADAVSTAILAERKFKSGNFEKISPEYIIKSYIDK